MKSYTLNILWTKEGDGQPHQRKRTVSVEVPVEGDITAIQDALLSLPGWTPEASYGESRTVRLPDSLADDLNDVGILTRIIPQARAEMEAAAREKVEQKEAHHAKRRAKLEAWLDSGDPDNTPWGVDDKRVGEVRSERHPSYLRNVMHHSLSDKALGWLEGHDDLRQRIEVRLESLNSIAGQQARAKLDAADDERDATRAEQEAKDAAKQERDDTRAAEIKEWAAEHGSTRLKAQIELGLDGWPLYLHERLTADWTPVTGPGTDDFASPELDNDGEHGVTLVNPSLLLAKAAKQIATRAVELGLAADIDDAIGSIEIVPIEFAIDSDDYSEEEMCERQEYVTFAGYRPGSEAFETKTIRFRCEE